MTTYQYAPDGTEYTVSDPIPAAKCYPKTNAYEFGEFAGPVIEFGGYGDATLDRPVDRAQAPGRRRRRGVSV